MPKIGNDFYLPTPAQMFLRKQGAGKAMLLCVIDEDDVPDNLGMKQGCFLIGGLTLHIKEARDPGEKTAGYRADQILCQLWDLQKMELIEIASQAHTGAKV